jgi:phytol kinase
MPELPLLPPGQTLTVAAATALWATIAASWVGRLRARGLRAPYTRKIFHFLILSSAALVHWQWGLAGVLVFGSVIAGAVLYAVYRGDGFPFYEALARPTDAPRRSLFILVPLVTTAAGGLLANVLFGDWAPVGYLVVAWGDAVGEPVGTRWGRHPYSVPSIGGIRANRTLEGSAAVVTASVLAAFVALLSVGVDATSALPAALAIGLAAGVVEAVSHHGLDNLTVQVAAAGLAALLLG